MPYIVIPVKLSVSTIKVNARRRSAGDYKKKTTNMLFMPRDPYSAPAAGVVGALA